MGFPEKRTLDYTNYPRGDGKQILSTEPWLKEHLKDNLCIHAHSPKIYEGHNNIFIHRDPRNMLLCVYKRKRTFKLQLPYSKIYPSKSNRSALCDFLEKEIAKPKWFPHMRAFNISGDCLIVKFETFQKDASRIANFLNRPNTPPDWAQLENNLTFSGNNTQYMDWWTSEIDDIFTRAGGNQLVKDMGYETFN
jgi:hypothetical protein